MFSYRKLHQNALYFFPFSAYFTSQWPVLRKAEQSTRFEHKKELRILHKIKILMQILNLHDNSRKTAAIMSSL